MSEMSEMSEMSGLEDLREQAEVEKIYREAVDTLIVMVLAYGDMPDGRSVVLELVREFPGSNAAFWVGVLQMTADALAEDWTIPEEGGDGG